MSKSAPEHLAQALLAGLMQGLGEKYNDQQLINAGLKLGAIAIKNDRDSRSLWRRFIVRRLAGFS